MRYIALKLTEDQLFYAMRLMVLDRDRIEEELGEYSKDERLERQLAFSQRTSNAINSQLLAKAKTV